MEKEKFKFHPTVWLLIIGTLVSRLGSSMTIPFMSFFLHEKVGLNLIIVGFIIGISFLMYALAGFWGGVLSDFIGRKKLLLLSFFLYAFIFIGFGWASHFHAQAVILSILFSILNMASGATRSWYETISQALIGDLTTENQKTSAFGLRYVAINIGTAIGPLIGMLFGFAGSFTAFYATGIILLVFFVIFFYFIKNFQEPKSIYFSENTPPTSLRNIITVIYHDKPFIYFILGCILIYFGFVQHEALLGQIVFMRLHELTTFSILLILNAVLVIILQVPMNYYLSSRYDLLTLIYWGVILLVLGLVGFGWSTTSLEFIISEVIFSVGEILIFSYISVVIDNLAPEALRGSYFGAANLQFFGRFVGPIVNGMFLQYLHILPAMLIVAFITLLSCLFFKIGMIKLN